MTRPNNSPLNLEQPGIIPRPEGQLQDLPLRLRWEATRRHPYYLVFWLNALLYQQGEIEELPEQRMMGHIASLMLGCIRVTGQPVSPKMSFEELDDDRVDPAFLSGALQPITCRGVAAMLISALPCAELAALGSLFINASDAEYAIKGDDDSKSIQKNLAKSRLAQISSPAFDSYPDSPLFYIHLGASQRTILDDVTNQVNRWKRRRGIEERRVPKSKLLSYLDVWDLREGWTGEGYDQHREKKLIDIAKQMKKPINTIFNQYQSAFEIITGHRFSPALWYRLFAPLKLNRIFQNPEATFSGPMRRRLSAPVRRPIPDSSISPAFHNERGASVVEQGSIYMDDQALTDILIDAEEMIAKKLSNEEIAIKLGCSTDIIEYLRERSGDHVHKTNHKIRRFWDDR